jgi:hypothetical protein
MQKLRPYVLPGLFVFHLVVLCVTLSTVSRKNETSEMTAVVTIVSQFLLTALFAGLGSGSWSLRIPSWGALAALSWLSFVFFAVHSDGRAPDNEFVWGVALAPIICWIVLVTLLLCLRAIPFLKWRFALQPTLAAPQSNQPHQDSLTRGILIVVASWAGVLMLLKDSWPWSAAATAISESPDDLLMVSGVAALVGAGALVVVILAVGLTLTRLADWMFYRRRWTLPLLAILLTGTAIMSLLSFGGPFKDGSEWLLAVCWLLAGMATQPLATLLVMGLAGYRLAPRKQPDPDASESSFQATTTTTEKPAANWFLRLQRPHVAALVAVLLFFVGFVPTGVLNRHHLTMVSSRRGRVNNAGEITRLTLSEWATNNSLRALSDIDNLQSLGLHGTQITDAGLVHLKGLNLKELTIPKSAQTDLGLKHYLAAIEPRSVLYLRDWGGVTDAGLVHLKGLIKLEELNLASTRITDAGLVHLKGLTNLQELYLTVTKITDAGLVHLKGLPNLQTLGLSGTKITDAGLVHLKGLTGLQTLNLYGTKITDAGVANLKKSLPNCNISK